MTYDFTYLSLGAGVQSSALLLMSSEELFGVPKADIAIFSDTQSEPPWVYEHLEKLHELATIPIISVTAGNLHDDTLSGIGAGHKNFITIPVYSANLEGEALPLRRQCTYEYKIQPIQKEIRRQLGYKPRMRVKENVQALLGISLDESLRMKPSRYPYITNEYPLIDARFTRQDCLNILQEYGWSVPKKSACVFCPFHRDSNWKDYKDNHPEVWKEIVAFDEKIRTMGKMTKKDSTQFAYLHRSLQPINDVDFTKGGQLQFDIDGFNDECEGMCGV